MRSRKQCTPYIHDLLDLVQEWLLVPKETNPSTVTKDKGRYSIEQACVKLNQMMGGWGSQEYCCGTAQPSPSLRSKSRLVERTLEGTTATVGGKVVAYEGLRTDDHPESPVW